jgi:dipeptidyl-peptidase-4
MLATALLAAASMYGESSEWRTTSLSSQGRWVGVQDSAGAVWLINGASQHKQRLAAAGNSAAAFSWSADDQRVAVEQQASISVYDTRSGNLRYTLDGTSADFAPNGQNLAFIRGHNVWIASADGQQTKPLTSNGNPELLAGETDSVYAREFDVPRHYWWAPDSSAIAYIETRYQGPDHYVLPGKKLPVFALKVLELTTGRSTTVFATDDSWAYLFRVAWLPDSKQIAFYRMNRPQNAAELCVYRGDGKVDTLLQEKDNYWIDVPAAPLFNRNGSEVLVTSGRSGHRHVYLYDLRGALKRDLTPGDMEVYHLYPGPLVAAGTGTKQEQQLFHLSFAGGAAKQLTKQPGWHEIQVDHSGNTYLDTYSTATTAPVVHWNRKELFHSSDAGDTVASEFLQIQTHDGVLLPARLYKPQDFAPAKKYPLIVYTYSGPMGRVVRDEWGGWEMDWNRAMVRRGYLVLAVDLRGSGGYGQGFEEYLHYRLGAQEISDLREVRAYLSGQPYVDMSRLGIWGNEYGGHVTVHAMLEVPGGFAAGFALEPITDWRQYDAYFTERYLGPPRSKGIDYDDSSALDSARKLTGTLLVAQRSVDPAVPQANISMLKRRMAKVKQPGVADRFSTMEAREDLQARMSDFFAHAFQ